MNFVFHFPSNGNCQFRKRNSLRLKLINWKMANQVILFCGNSNFENPFLYSLPYGISFYSIWQIIALLPSISSTSLYHSQGIPEQETGTLRRRLKYRFYCFPTDAYLGFIWPLLMRQIRIIYSFSIWISWEFLLKIAKLPSKTNDRADGWFVFEEQNILFQ